MKKLASVVFSMLFIFSFTGIATAKVWNYTQITNSLTDQRHASMDEKDIVWVGNDNSGKYSVFHYDVDAKIAESLSAGKLTGHFGMPSVSNGQVAIRSYDRANTENYYLYSLADHSYQKIGSSPVGPYNPYWGYPPSYHSLDPMLNKGEVVYSYWDGHDYEVMSWKNGVTTQITNNDTDDYEPQVWDGKISWTGKGSAQTGVDVFLYNNGTITNISHMLGTEEDSFIADGKVAHTGQAYVNGRLGSFDIYLHDIASGQSSVVASKPNQDYEPTIYQNTLAWNDQRQEKGQYIYDTYYHDGYKLDQLHSTSDPLKSAIGPYVHKDKVVYSEQDENGVYQIMMASYRTGGYNPSEYQGLFRDAETNGKIAYVAQGTFGVGVYDLSDPTQPTRVSKLNTSGESFSLARDGNRLYSAAREGGIDVYDISNRNTPAYVANIALQGVTNKIIIDNGVLYAGSREGLLSMVDLHTPTQVTGQIQLPSSLYGMSINNDMAYIAGYTSGLYMVDLADKSSPELVNTLSLREYGKGKVWDVTMDNDIFFLSMAGYGLLAYDFNDPLAPIKLGSLAMPNGDQLGGWEATYEIVIRNGIAFVSAGTQGIFAVDIRDPGAMNILERYETPGFAWSASIVGKYLMGQDYQGGFNLYDISDYFPELALAPTPVPPSVLLFGTGLFGIIIAKRRKITN